MLRRIGICLLALGLAACNGTMDQSGALKWPLGGGPVMNPTIHAATAQAVNSCISAVAAGVPVTQRAPQGFEPARRNFKPALKREIPNPRIMSGASVIYAQQDGRTCYVTVSPAIRSDMNDLKPLIAQALAGRERSILAEHAFDFNASTLNLRFRLR